MDSMAWGFPGYFYLSACLQGKGSHSQAAWLSLASLTEARLCRPAELGFRVFW